MDYLVTTYCCADFDGRIYVKITGRSEFKSARVQLLKDGHLMVEKHTTDNCVMFKVGDIALYQAIVVLTLADDSLFKLTSNTTSVALQTLTAATSPYVDAQNVKGTQQLCEGARRHYLELKLQKGCLERLQAEPAAMLVKSHDLICHAPLRKISLKACWQDEEDLEEEEQACDRYIIEQDIADEDMMALAQELEQLDYVIYCAVVPDINSMDLPESPVPGPDDIVPGALVVGPASATVTPSLVASQTYMNAGMGMNISAVRANGERGQWATVRIMDTGIRANHEDLAGNVRVISTRPAHEITCHGTATTGCIAARNDALGVTGIASDCNCFFYNGADIDRVVQDARAGDIVTITVSFGYPVIFSFPWWERIHILSRRGVTVLISAGNLSENLANRRSYGDSGATLVGACYHNTGRRVGFSGHNFPFMMNSWGNWSVATTGYGDLFNGVGNIPRTYTATYSGTSSATALCGGALALIQSHAIGRRGSFLTPARFRELIGATGYDQARGDGIGLRPNVMAAITALDQEANVPPVNPPPVNPPPVNPPPVNQADRITTQPRLSMIDSGQSGNQTNAPINLRNLFAAHAAIEVHMAPGMWLHRLELTEASLLAQGQGFSFFNNQSFSRSVYMNGNPQAVRINANTVRRFVVRGSQWQEV